MFLRKIKKTIDSFAMLASGEKIVAGASGGSDSMALLIALDELREWYPDINVIVSHVNHGLRGRESDTDAEFVREAAENLGFAFECVRVDTEAFRKSRGLSLEDAARRLRYDFFKDIAAKRSAQKIATAHTLNDQAETVIMRLIRGSASQGLSGIRPLSGNLIRPLINVTKDEARSYLHSKGVSWREDSSNSSERFLRNRVRKELIPMLEKFNPSVQRVLSRAAAVYAEEADFISDQAERKFKILFHKVAGGVFGRAKDLLDEPPAIRFSLMRKSILALKLNLDSISSKHLFSIDEALKSKKSSAEFDLPGGIIFYSGYGNFFFARKDEFQNSLRGLIEGCGSSRISEDLEITAELTSDLSLWEKPNVGYFPPEKVDFPIKIRSFIEGDRFVPLGMSGTKKLKNFFIDEKIPKFIRKKVPVFETRNGIIWLGGLRTDERFKADQKKAPWLRIDIRGSLTDLLDLATRRTRAL